MINADKRFMFCFSYLDLFRSSLLLFTPDFPGNLLSPLSLLFHFFPYLFPSVKKAVSLPTPSHCVNWKVELSSCQSVLKLPCEQWFLQGGRYVAQRPAWRKHCSLRSVASGLEKALLAGYLKTVLCQSLSVLTNLVPRPTQIQPVPQPRTQALRQYSADVLKRAKGK